MLRETMTENGAVRGIAASDPSITVFKGIPFAAPPVGRLRWRAPQRAENWSGCRVCDTFGPPSMQKLPNEQPDFYTREFYVTPDTPMCEDCLYLNIWTPVMRADEKLPVMVWIFGGGMCAGYTSEMEFDGERIARRGVVFVSVNYRLNSFGFLSHPDLTREGRANGEAGTNFGLLDQSAALGWVRRNIACFGGDRDNVTLFGQSAGGRCVWMHMAAPSDRGLFDKAILQSAGMGGGITRYPGRLQAEAAGVRFFEHLGVSTLEEARGLPAEVIRDRTMTFDQYRWGPVIDGHYLPESPLSAVTSGRANSVPLLMGSTLRDPDGFRVGNDPEAFHARARLIYGSDYDKFAKLCGVDSVQTLNMYYESPAFSTFEIGNAYVAERWLEQGKGPVYLYRFNPDIPGDDAGAFHSSDLWFVFETLAKCWRPFVGKHYDLARQMCNYWTNFAKTGNPNGLDHNGMPMPEWKPCADGRSRVMFFGDAPQALEERTEALMRFELDRLKKEAERENVGGVQ